MKMKNLNKRLKHFREITGLRQAQVAELISVSANTVSDYERGISEPSLETLIKLSKIYKVSFDTLIGLKEPEIKPSQYLIKFNELTKDLNDEKKEEIILLLSKIINFNKN
jgi:transcriptional regulator with XRE-family HTH domain